MPPEHDYTHRDIWVAITDLSGKIDSMLREVARMDRSLEGEDGLLARQRKLETQMAQVRLIGALAVLLMPFITTLLQSRLAIPAAIEQQEGGK